MNSYKNGIVNTLVAFFTIVICITTILVVAFGGKLTDMDGKISEKNSGTEITEKHTEKPTGGEDETTNTGNIVVEDKSDMTIIVYIVGSNLESECGYATRDLEILADANFGDNINVVVQAGGASKWNNNLLKDGHTHRFTIADGRLKNIDDMGKVNMASEDTLSDFLKYAAEEYPAEKYTLILWNHGGSIPLQYGADDMFPGEEITYAELNTALKEANIHFDTIVFNACLMATLEVAMSVMDYADYMVAAESVIWGGLDFTNWLASIKRNPDASPVKHCEILMEDYMEFLEYYDLLGSISLLELDKIDEVYTEYVKYAKEVSEDLRNKQYEKYYKLRDGCGYYSNTDSVDIITLATLYETDASDDLIKAVEEAVVYSDSDYDYGNGLATYSPHQGIAEYNLGRVAMEEMGYDESILDYYDVYCSISLKYMGDSAVNMYAGTWYDVAAVDAHIGGDVNTNPTNTELATIDKNGQEVVRFTDAELQLIKMIYAMVGVQYDDNHFVLLGSETYLEFDQDGDLVVGLPDAWTRVNGHLACIVLLDRYVDYETGEWEEISAIPAKRNGEDILLVVYYSNDCPDGMILGYVNTTHNYENDGEYEDSYIYTFNDDDIINLVHPLIDFDANVEYTQIVEEDILASQLVLSYEAIDLSEMTVMSYIEVEDIYGNTYTTEAKFYN